MPNTNTPMTYKIEVQDRRNGNWRTRTTLPASSPNDALKQYGIAGTRPRLGQATSKSGKRFRALNTGRVSRRQTARKSK